MNSKKIADALGIEENETEEYIVAVKKVKSIKRKVGTNAPNAQTVIDDYNMSKSIIEEMLEGGTSLLNIAIQSANETQHPRSIEVATALMKQLTECSKDLVELNKTLLEMQAKEAELNKKRTGENGESEEIHQLTASQLAKLVNEVRDN